MDWIKITINTSDTEETCAKLSAMGYDQLEIDDHDELEDFIKNKKPIWQLVDDELLKTRASGVSLYLPEGSKLDEFADFDFTCTVVREQDWMNNWRQYYKPISIGKRILIQPEWEPLSGEDGRAVFWCDPGVSFGTGTHATTRMCLEYLDELVKPGDSVADLGCGSGILSVTAMLLGASRASALDIDPQAVGAARHNAERNNVELRTEQADLLDDENVWAELEREPWDIVCANLVADLIVPLAPRIKKIVKRGGCLLISGVLENNAGNVRASLENAGFSFASVKTGEGWIAAQFSN